MPATYVLLALVAPPTNADLYFAFQRRLRAAKTVMVTTYPTSGNNWDSEIAYRFMRPNLATKGGMNVSWTTDGTRTGRDDADGRYIRLARPGDIHEAYMPGFEALSPSR